MLRGLSKNESKVFFAVMRKTFGFNKPIDWVAGEQLSLMTRLDKANALKALRRLVKDKVLIKSGRRHGVNPNLSEWCEGFKECENVVVKKKTNKDVMKMSPSELVDEYGEEEANKILNKLNG